MRILVTGGSGFIGTNLIGRLLERSDSVLDLSCTIIDQMFKILELPQNQVNKQTFYIGDPDDDIYNGQTLLSGTMWPPCIVLCCD